MEEKYLEYGVFMINCPILKPINLENISSNILKIVIEIADKEKPNTEEKIIKIYLSESIKTVEQAEHEVEETIDNILNGIAFNVKGSTIGFPYFIKSKGLGERQPKTHECIIVESNIKSTMVLEASLKNYNNYASGKYQLFRAAMNCSDVIARFMLLYQILLTVCRDKYKNESQSTADKRIKDWYVNIKGTKVVWNYPIGRPKETIITKLRNQVGHNRDISSYETRSEMREYIDDLIEIVKYEIEHWN